MDAYPAVSGAYQLPLIRISSDPPPTRFALHFRSQHSPSFRRSRDQHHVAASHARQALAVEAAVLDRQPAAFSQRDAIAPRGRTAALPFTFASQAPAQGASVALLCIVASPLTLPLVQVDPATARTLDAIAAGLREMARSGGAARLAESSRLLADEVDLAYRRMRDQAETESQLEDALLRSIEALDRELHALPDKLVATARRRYSLVRRRRDRR